MDTTSTEFLNQVNSASAFFKEQGKVSVAEFQRKFQIGFARAVAICDELVKRGELIHVMNGYHFNLPSSDINRFVLAQDGPIGNYKQALAEVKKGRKTSHWIWYIFPQLRGLGHSGNANFYGIEDLQEARVYLAHPVLGARLREITQVVLDHADDRLTIELMGSEIDMLKLKSSMTLFDQACPNDIFSDVLNAYYDGERCGRTLRMLKD